MNLGIIFSVTQPIPVHAVFALFSVAAGSIQFALPKGTLPHRALGYLWAVSMFIVAASSFFINEFQWVGIFGPIHVLSCLVLWSLWRGIYYAKKKDIPAHRSAMKQLYFFSLLVAGAFTLLPGRIMHEVVFG